MPEDPESREVIEQSEEIMQNYMFGRFSTDNERGTLSGSSSPTLLENFTRRPRTYGYNMLWCSFIVNCVLVR